MLAVAEDFCTSILNEVKLEPNSSDQKKEIIDQVIASVGSADWLMFVQLLAEPIAEALTERNKLLPSNQYEEFLINFNKFLNDKQSFVKLRSSFELLVGESHRSSGTVKIIFSRLCQRLPEEIQIFIMQEMVKNNVPSELPDSDIDKSAFSSEISDMLRCYYIRSARLRHNEVWRVRCRNIKSSFICVDDDTEEDIDILLKTNWINGNVSLSSDFYLFCEGVENFIRAQFSMKGANQDDLVLALLDPANVAICNYWYNLTADYFSETDSLLFMRDFVTILLRKSLKAEEALVRAKQQEIQKLTKVAVRENLKRN